MDGSGHHDNDASPMAAGEQQPHPDPVADDSPVLLLWEHHLPPVLLILLPEISLDVDVGDDDASGADSDANGDMVLEEYGDEDAYRDGGFGAIPASGEAITGLAEAAVGETREAECAVCMESFVEGEKLRKMPCSHSLHESCIFEWLRVSRLCPHCRFALAAAADDKGSDMEMESENEHEHSESEYGYEEEVDEERFYYAFNDSDVQDVIHVFYYASNLL